MKVKIIFLALSVLNFLAAFPQQRADSTTKSGKRYLLTGLPVVFYTPETRFGFGVTGLCFFNFHSDTLMAPRSSVSLGAVYTQNKQILLSIPYNLFLQNRSYQLYGEFAFNRFNYFFYGVGNDVPQGYRERYGVEFPRIRITALKKILPHFYLGPRYAFDKYRLFELVEKGQLASGNIKGSGGGIVSGLGLVFLLDTRDNIFYPSKGEWGELVLYHDNPLTGSTFKYTRIAFDFAKYFHYRQNILALNLYSIYADSDLPFFQMGILGGVKKMRGFYEGRYRDNNILVLQGEYRRMVYGPIGFTVFGNLGQVARRYQNFDLVTWRYTYGVGLRLQVDKAQKINLRFDLAIGDKMILPYFTVTEAF